jgi:mRNA-degrading endonuclease RelE of RelBE toxin-antitoxin system
VFTFVEAPLFTRLVGGYLTDEEYAALQHALAKDPELGDIIPHSGGVRKVRWRGSGRGKRGGVRVIYFVRSQQGVIWMLTIYAKNVAETIPTHLLRRIRKEIENA